MRLYFPVDLTGNLIMIEKLVLGGIWTGGLPIFNPDALTAAPSSFERNIEARIHIRSSLAKLTNSSAEWRLTEIQR